MRKSIHDQVVSSTSMHLKIQHILDQFQRSFQLKSQPIPADVKDNIRVLRGLVNQTENADVLVACFKRHVLSMRTYKEYWNMIWPSDCFLCTYTYMTIAIKGVEKDTEIAQLRKEKLQLEEKLLQQEKDYESQRQQLEKSSEDRVGTVSAEMQANLSGLEESMQSIREEVASLKGANEVLEKRLVESQARITQVDNENTRLIAQLGAMQNLIDVEFAVQDNAPVIDVHVGEHNVTQQLTAISVKS